MSEPLADGIYLGLPMDDYVNDPALSGSGIYKLLTEPAALRWESEANPLFEPAERKSTKGQLRGSAAHCAVLEGMGAYEAVYMVKPEGMLSSSDDLKGWLRTARAKLEDQLGAGLKREEAKPYLLTGDKADLIARIRALDPEAPVWDEDAAGGRQLLSADDDQYVRVVERFLRGLDEVAPHISGGLPEVTIVLTKGGIRWKCRVDYLTADTVLDMKSYGRPPNRGKTLREHCIATAGFSGYDLQAVHNHRMVMAAGERFRNKTPDMVLECDAREVGELSNIFYAHARKAPVFRWLFVRMAGAPTAIIIPFRESDGQWQMALEDIAAAERTFIEFRDQCGEGIWMQFEGEQELEDTDWPLSIMRGRY